MLLCGLALAVILLLNGCGPSSNRVILFVASSLVQPVDEFSRTFEGKHPEIEIIREAGGSQLHCRKISELNKPCDVLILAEPRFFSAILDKTTIDWHIDFGTNEIVVIYTDRSRHNGEITPGNWPEIILRPDVVIGRVDENIGPVGFRTLHVWKLASRYYNRPDLYNKLMVKTPPENMRPDATAVLPPLENGTFDYAFDYRSVAKQHRLQYVKLPEEINLGSREKADSYSSVSVNIRANDGSPLPLTGVPIQFGLSIPRDAPHPKEAALYVAELLSPEGKKILQENYQPVLGSVEMTGVENIPLTIRSAVSSDNVP